MVVRKLVLRGGWVCLSLTISMCMLVEGTWFGRDVSFFADRFHLLGGWEDVRAAGVRGAESVS